MKHFIPLGLILLSACASAERNAPYTSQEIPAAQAGGFECTAKSAQYGLGQTASVALAQELLSKAGATILRWLPPRTAVTMDYSPVRLNISYDDAMIITRITCG